MKTSSLRGLPEPAAEIEQRRVFFEQSWGTPTAPTIEQLLDEVPTALRSDLLSELLYVEFEFMLRESDAPPLDSYVRRFPEYEAVVREAFQSVHGYTAFRSKKVGEYTLLGEIGSGGMGVVYRAKHAMLNHVVALKMVNRRVVNNPESRRRFSRELDMIGRLRHPNIVEAKYAGITPDGTPYLVMEYLDGITFKQWRTRVSTNYPEETLDFEADSSDSPPGALPSAVASSHGPKSGSSKSNGSSASRSSSRLKFIASPPEPELPYLREACRLIRDAAQGLQAIHEAHLVHRDIKPGNLVRQPDGTVKILDLGLAKLRQHLAENQDEIEPQTRQGILLGTPAYMAPEQMHSAARVDIRADIYSLGCTFFYLLHGRAPSESTIESAPPPLPVPIQTILDSMLAADPANRFQEPRDVVEALEHFLDPAKKAASRGTGSGMSRLSQALAALSLCLFVLLLVVFFRGKDGAAARSPSEFGTKSLPNEASLVPVSLFEPALDGLRPPDEPISEIALLSRPLLQKEIDLRYQGDTEQAATQLQKREKGLREQEADYARSHFDTYNDILAQVLSAEGDCVFFSGLASRSIPDKKVKTMLSWYEEALERLAESPSGSPAASSTDSREHSRDLLRAELISKKTIVESVCGETVAAAATWDLLRPLANENGSLETKRTALFQRLAEAVKIFHAETDDRALRTFVEHFDLNSDPDWNERSILELRLFALEHLIYSDNNTASDKLGKDLRSLDAVLSSPFQDADSCVFLNRFFDLALRYGDPHDYSLIVKYLYRFRPTFTTGSRLTAPPDATRVLFYFSPVKNVDGFALYYPADPRHAKRFELPFNRSAVREAIDQEEPLSLDENLVALIRQDLAAGIPIILSWDDTACWSRHRDAFTSADWPFDASITVEDILGKLK